MDNDSTSENTSSNLTLHSLRWLLERVDDDEHDDFVSLPMGDDTIGDNTADEDDSTGEEERFVDNDCGILFVGDDSNADARIDEISA